MQTWPGQHLDGSAPNAPETSQAVAPKLGRSPPHEPVVGSHVVPVPHASGQLLFAWSPLNGKQPPDRHPPSLQRFVESGKHGVRNGAFETWQTPPLHVPVWHSFGGIGEHDVPSGMLPAMHSPPAQIPSIVDRHRSSAGGGGLQYPKSLMLAGAHWPFWQVPTVGDKHALVVRCGVHAAPSLIGVWTQTLFWLQDAAEQLDDGVHPAPTPSCPSTAQSPRSQKPLKHPSVHVTVGGFGKFSPRFVHAVRVLLVSQIWQGALGLCAPFGYPAPLMTHPA
jgi:hypothetical protein